MKTKNLLMAALALSALASCQDYNNGFTESEIKSTEEYNRKFEEQFGKINPDHNWGFDLIPMVNVDNSLSTRAAYTNSNLWSEALPNNYHYDLTNIVEADGTTKPWGWTHGDVTQYERAYVYWWFSTHRWPTSNYINWSDYFIQSVWGQPEHSWENADGTAYAGGARQFGMDKLGHIQPSLDSEHPIGDIVDVATAKNHIVTEDRYEHINDFNAGGNAKEQVMFMYNASTKDFGCRTPFNNEYHNNWTIQYINGNYYLAFDYWHEKTESGSMKYEEYNPVLPDGYYNDWILKLSTGHHQATYSRRVMCEDLGNTFDWDFNDAVFDVTGIVEDSKFYAIITLQAAGGTMPIYVGDMQHEAHAMFGVPTTQPVNVAAGVMRPAVVYRVELTESQFTKETVSETVGGATISKDYYYLRTNEIPIYVPSRSSTIDMVPLKNASGEAPQKICCPNDTYWMKEYKRIDTGHPAFARWVEEGNKDETIYQDANDNGHDYFTTKSNVGTAGHTWSSELYADAGEPYANSYHPGVAGGWTGGANIQPWETLWNGCQKSGNAFDQEWTYTKNYTGSDGEKVPNETYTRCFKDEAPYIFTCSNSNTSGNPLYKQDAVYGNDLYAISPNCMQETLEYMDGVGYPLTAKKADGTNSEVTISCNVTLRASNDDRGSVSGGGSYSAGTSVSVTATANVGYKFTGWTRGGSIVSTANPYTFTIQSPTTLVANFEFDYDQFDTGTTYTSGNIPSTITLTSGVNTYLVTVTAKTAEGYNGSSLGVGSWNDYCGPGVSKTFLLKDVDSDMSVTNAGDMAELTVRPLKSN